MLRQARTEGRGQAVRRCGVLGGKVASLASPVVHRLACLSDPNTPQARLLSALCRSFLMHRVIKGTVLNVWGQLDRRGT